MQKLTDEEKKANIEEYKKMIHPPRPGEPLVPVRVVHPGGFSYSPTPSTSKKYMEGEELMVPEHIWLNTDYHAPKKTVSGIVLRGVLERTDQHPVAGKATGVAMDDNKALVDRIKELERQLLIATGRPPQEPLVVIDRKEEEI